MGKYITSFAHRLALVQIRIEASLKVGDGARFCGRASPLGGCWRATGRQGLLQLGKQTTEAQVLDSWENLHLDCNGRENVFLVCQPHFSCYAAELGPVAAFPQRCQNSFDLRFAQYAKVNQD